MFKKILVFSDGTGNSASSTTKTNVYRLYDALDKSADSGQVAYYDDGVGSSSHKLLAAFGGAFGFGLKRNVLDLYKFISREYHKALEHGERPIVACFGFSRGAYTIRVLLALIESEGLLPDGDDDQIARWAPLAYEDFRKKRSGTWLHLEVPLRVARDLIYRRHDYDPSKNLKDGVTIDFVGLWDTVSAYGMPIAELERAIDKFLFPLNFRDHEQLPKIVRTARHALAIDEERESFTPILFDESDIDDGRSCIQLWFAGVHANVGGGYPDDTMAYLPLYWIMQEAKKQHVVFRPEAEKELAARATPFGKIYDSRAGIQGLYRYAPRPMLKLLNPKNAKAQPRPILHESVIYRLAYRFDGYAPIVLPDAFAVADQNGDIIYEFGPASGPEEADGASSRTRPANAKISRELTQAIERIKNRAEKHRQLIDTAIFWRRFFYILTIIPVVILLFLPLVMYIWDDTNSGGPEPGLAFFQGISNIVSWLGAGVGAVVTAIAPSLQENLAAIGRSLKDFSGLVIDLFADMIASLSAFLGKFFGYAEPWLNCYVKYRYTALLLVLFALAAYYWGSGLRCKINDRSRAVWNGEPPKQRRLAASLWDPLARGILQQKWLGNVWENSVRQVIPTFLALCVIPVIFLSITDRGLFQLESYFGLVCSEQDGSKILSAGETREFNFAATEPCNHSGVKLQKDRLYKLSFSLPQEWGEQEPAWAKADVSGLDLHSATSGQKLVYGVTALLARRVLSEPWFKPMLRVGGAHNNEFPANPTKPFSPDSKDRHLNMEMEFKAPADGELLVYVNDTYSGLLPFALVAGRVGQGSWRHTYGNNLTGVGKVTVTPL